jgi:hypothetical protein
MILLIASRFAEGPNFIPAISRESITRKYLELTLECLAWGPGELCIAHLSLRIKGNRRV